MSNQKQAEELAAAVALKVVNAGVRKEILDALLKGVELNLMEACTEAILTYAGKVINEQNQMWARELSAAFIPKSGRVPANPGELEEEIMRWHGASIKDAEAGAYKAGYEAAFAIALLKGAKLGWATREAGGRLEEVEAKCKTIKAT